MTEQEFNKEMDNKIVEMRELLVKRYVHCVQTGESKPGRFSEGYMRREFALTAYLYPSDLPESMGINHGG